MDVKEFRQELEIFLRRYGGFEKAEKLIAKRDAEKIAEGREEAAREIRHDNPALAAKILASALPSPGSACGVVKHPDGNVCVLPAGHADYHDDGNRTRWLGYHPPGKREE